MPLLEGEKVYTTDKRLYRTKEGAIVGEDDPRKLTLVAVPGHRMSLARAQTLGLLSADEAGAVKDTAVTGREDRVTPLTGAPADRADRVQRLTPATPASSAPADNAKTATKSMPAPEDKSVRKTTKRKRGQ